jgi:hypothetical protein
MMRFPYHVPAVRTTFWCRFGFFFESVFLGRVRDLDMCKSLDTFDNKPTIHYNSPDTAIYT